MPTENRSSNTEKIVRAQAAIEALGEAHTGDSALDSKREAELLLRKMQIQLAEQPHAEPSSYPPCDYCGITPDYHPWHGSGLLSGVENRHIHACDACRGRLPLHPEQHQREPVALPARRQWNGLGNAADNLKASGWNACLDAIAKIGPLYTHADPREAERPSQMALSLQTKLKSVESERDRLRAILAEQEHSARELLRIIGMSVQGSAAYNRAVIAFHDSLNADTKPN